MKKYILKISFIIIFVFSIFGHENIVYGKVGSGGWSLLSITYDTTDKLSDISATVNGENVNIVNEINGFVDASKQPKYNSYASYEEYKNDSQREGYKETEVDESRKHPLTNPLVIMAKVTARPIDAGSYMVTVGNKTIGDHIAGIQQNQELYLGSGVKKEAVLNELAYPGDSDDLDLLEYGKEITWDIAIIATVTDKGIEMDDGTKCQYDIIVDKVLSGEDLDFKNYEEFAKQFSPEPIKIGDSEKDPYGTKDEEGDSFNAASFVSDVVNSIISLLLDFAKTLFGDVPQMLANLLQTGFKDEETGRTNLRIDFKPEDLEDNTSDSVSNPNAYIKYSKGKTGASTWQKEVTIPEGVKIDPVKLRKQLDEGIDENTIRNEKAYEFSPTTQIPLISVDFYTLAANKVEIVNANFLDTDGIENKTWIFIRNFIASIVHAIMYLTAAIIITAIIWNGILMVKDSFGSNSAKEKQKHNEMMMKLGKAVAMLLGTLFFEAICIYGSGLFLNQVGKIGGDTFEGPIRVYVDTPVDYSFSTTPTGYVRYMADISNKNLNKEKAIYVGIYILLAWANLIILILMMIRMLLMMLLAVIGFAIVIIFIFENNGTGMYKYISWAKIYLKFALIQVVIGIAFKILMEVAI